MGPIPRPLAEIKRAAGERPAVRGLSRAGVKGLGEQCVSFQAIGRFRVLPRL